MAFPLYLACTAAEFSNPDSLPAHPAWMACHFSGYSTGLSNLPTFLPAGSMLILNDRVPACGHDPNVISAQLRELAEALNPACILLDFQRPENSDTARIAAALADFPVCPLVVSELYAKELRCPVFLSPPPADCRLKDWLAPWQGRELWLEAALDSTLITVTETGSFRRTETYSQPPADCFRETALHCRYRIRVTEDSVRFHLFRTQEDLKALLQEAETLGVTGAAGLYQELGNFTAEREESEQGA